MRTGCDIVCDVVYQFSASDLERGVEENKGVSDYCEGCMKGLVHIRLPEIFGIVGLLLQFVIDNLKPLVLFVHICS